MTLDVSQIEAMDRAALRFLHGLTWRFRLDAQNDLNLRFAEGERLLGG